MQFSSVLSDNISHLHSLLDVGTNFDVVYRTARVGGRDACLYFVDGFTKDEVLLKILQAWSSIKPEAREFDSSFFGVLMQILYLSHLRLIFLSNFVIFIVLLCTLCGIIKKTDFIIGEKRYVYIYHWK